MPIAILNDVRRAYEGTTGVSRLATGAIIEIEAIAAVLKE